MEAVLLLTATLAAVAVVLAVGRWGRDRRHGGSRTVTVRVARGHIERDLRDGRAESVALSSAVQVEIVRTPVPTADGARAFVLLAESLDEDDPRGCLVPLGVGWDDALLDALVRLPGFDLRAWASARDRPHPGREIVWRRSTGGGG